MSDRNTAISSLDSHTLKPYLQLSAVRSDLAVTLQEQLRAQSELIRASTQGLNMVRQFQEQQRELISARTQGLDMVRRFQEQQRDLIRAAIHPPFLTIGKQQRKRKGSSVREPKSLRQENSELRRHQQVMFPPNQPGDGEFWMSQR